MSFDQERIEILLIEYGEISMSLLNKLKNNNHILYEFYRDFLKKYQSYYNTFFLADLTHWMADQTFLESNKIKHEWEKYIRIEKEGGVINFYIHIPFCESKCDYCMYYSQPSKKNNIDAYIKKLIEQFHFFQNTFRDVEFASLYVGGGTPSILSEKQINSLFSSLFKRFKFKSNCEKTFELNPKSITRSKLVALQSFGFNRISFGVQTFNDDVLSAANRNGQTKNLIQTTIINAKDLGFEVNTDIMVGIKNDKIETVIDSFKILAQMKPDSITLYPFKPQKDYLKKHFNNDYKKFNSSLDKEALAVRKKLKAIIDEYGYDVREKSFEIYTSTEPVFFRKDFVPSYTSEYDYTSPINYSEPCSLFALGKSASSYIFNSMQYHDAVFDDNTKKFDASRKNYWVMRTDLKDEKRYFVLQQLSNRYCFSQKEFKTFFNSSFVENFHEEIRILKTLGKIKFKDDLVFFPSDPLSRFTACLFLFDKRMVENKIKIFLEDN